VDALGTHLLEESRVMLESFEKMLDIVLDDLRKLLDRSF